VAAPYYHEMTRKKIKHRPSRRSGGRDSSTISPARVWQWIWHREICGLALVTMGLVTAISLVARSEGSLSQAWALLLRQTFGLGAYVVGPFLVACGAALLLWTSLHSRLLARWLAIVGCELVFFASLGLAHVLASEPPLDLAQAGKRGGYVGWALWRLMVPLLGEPISVLVLVFVALAGICLATGATWPSLSWRVRWLLGHLSRRLRASAAARRARSADREPKPAASPRPVKGQPIQATLESAAVASAGSRPPLREGSTQREREARPKPRGGRAGLPPLDLLIADETKDGDDADARLRAQIIEETLASFGIPVRVVGWHRGPVVTQFDVEPGYLERQDRDGNLHRYKVRVSKIQALSKDLALALAAVPIRIEAPVPGRPVVGIEVPNAAKTLVGLQGVLRSSTFRKTRARLRIALGRDVSGSAVVANLGAMPHLLVSGATGSGKSVCLNAIIASLLFFNTPEQLKLLLIDPKRVELTRYNGIPHLVAPVVVDIEKVIPALRWVTRQMDRRYEDFAKAGARSLASYNRIARSGGLDPLPFIVIVIDELADIMFTAPDDAERTLCRLAQMARATGIHLVIATQRPSTDVVTGLIKANFPARISFAVTTQVDSRVILDAQGAEKLLGRGDMLFMAPDSAKLRRIQGCFVSDQEMDALAAFWRKPKIEAQPAPDQTPPWERDSYSEAEDPLLQEAIELVRQHDQASASFLQRQMRIGYPRAARIVDQLEKLGVVGPPQSGGRSRAVLSQAQADQEEAPPQQEVQA